jgi:ATP-dependent exoDNAse (exonuclease V) alpha subunit
MTQQEALDILKTDANVYLTGCAGSGKTFVVSKYISYLKQQGFKVGITASTGIAATQLGGITINAWAGIGIKPELTRQDIYELLKRRYLHRRIKETDVLIIDEVSMLPAHTLESVDRICQAFKRDQRPFGGIQVILCGDFFQLPPIQTKKYHGYQKYQEYHEQIETDEAGLYSRDTFDTQFIYKSPLWEDLDLKICYLDKPYRQVDLKFLTMLSEIRENKLTQHTWSTIKERFTLPIDAKVTPAKLFTHTADADAMNEKELAKLSGKANRYTMRVSGNERLVSVMKRSCLAPESLVLKRQALVMFVKNNTAEGYVNGTMGRVIDFTNDGFPIVETFAGKEITVKPSEWTIEEEELVTATVMQLPLRLAWAITIHKAQGMTLDAAEIDLGKSFVTGMGYVALSRVKTLEGLRLRSVNRTALSVNDEVIAVDKKFRAMSDALSEEIRESAWHRKNKLLSISLKHADRI